MAEARRGNADDRPGRCLAIALMLLFFSNLVEPADSALAAVVVSAAVGLIKAAEAQLYQVRRRSSPCRSWLSAWRSSG